MPESEKPTLHLEGLVLEAEVKQGGTPPKEFRKVKMGNLWLSCWTPGLYPLMVKGKYLAVDYITSQRGAFTNYNIQEATEAERPKPIVGPVSVLQSEPSIPVKRQATGYRDAVKDLEATLGHRLPDSAETRASIEAQVAAYCTAQVMAARENFMFEEVTPLICEFYRGMQAAKHTGAAAQPTEAIPNSPVEPVSRTPKAATVDSARPGLETPPVSDASSAAALTKPKEADITPTEFWKQWREAGLPTGLDLPAMIERVAQNGNITTVDKALKAGWTYRELLEAAKKVQA